SHGREMRGLDANHSPGELITMLEQVDRTTASQRIAVTILGVIGGIAVALAAIGLYGVMASSVSQGTRELALRMALGAGVRDLLRLVMSKGLALTASGLAVGGLAALQLTRLLGHLLYQVTPPHPPPFPPPFLLLPAP